MKLYTILNAVGYVVLGLWCAFAPFFTADIVGFTLLGGKGIAEYTAVYGGLQVALGIFFYLCHRTARLDAALLFGTTLYSCLVVFRIGGMMLHGTTTSDWGWALFGLEVTFAAWSWSLIRSLNRTLSNDARAS